jgi:hypothetical protein
VSIKIYVEGGGDKKALQSVGREAMKLFLSNLIPERAFKVIMCGGRQQTYDDFCVALKMKNPDEILLLVDAEAPVQEHGRSWLHLKNRKGDGWDQPENVSDDHAYMMVQTMEAWLICDPAAWKKWKSTIDTRSLPNHKNIEIIDKPKLNETCETMFKSIGASYKDNKRINGFGILKYVQPELVAQKSKEAQRFFNYLKNRTSQMEK